MASENAVHDANSQFSLLGVDESTGLETKKVKVSSAGGVLFSEAGASAASAASDAYANPTATDKKAFEMIYNGTTWDRAKGGQTSNSTTVTGFANNLPMARYNATPTTRTEGQFGNLQGDVNGNLQTNNATLLTGEDQTNGVNAFVEKPLAVSTYTTTKTQSNSFTTTNLKASAGVLMGFRCINTTASVRYIQFHNTATTPSGGATAQEKWQVPANSAITVGRGDLPIGGLYFATGIAYANSSVNSTYTAGSAGDLLLDVNYV